MSLRKIIIALALALPPLFPLYKLHASTFANIGDVTSGVNSVLGALVPLIIGFALFAFLWGIFMYLVHGDDESKREESKPFMIWGIVGLFVMVSVWGLVSLFANSVNFHLPNGLVPTLPNKEK